MKILHLHTTSFMEKGIGTSTMDKIAKVAGYNKATLYMYFENKEKNVGVLVLESKLLKKLSNFYLSAFKKAKCEKTSK